MFCRTLVQEGKQNLDWKTISCCSLVNCLKAPHVLHSDFLLLLLILCKYKQHRRLTQMKSYSLCMFLLQGVPNSLQRRVIIISISLIKKHRL